MAKFYGKDKKQVRSAVFAQAQSSLGVSSFKAGGRLRNLLEVFAELLFSLKTEDQEGLLDQVDYTRASGTALRQLALAHGIASRTATKASGTVQAQANKAGTLPAGAWLLAQQQPELRYKVTKEVRYSVSGTVDIAVQAESSGSKYNLISGSALRFSSVNLDLTLKPTTSRFPQSAGQDNETDHALRRRIAARFDAAFALDLQASRYEDTIYSQFPQVVQAKVVRTPRGAGSVDVYLRTAAGLPNADLLSRVRTELDKRRLLARDLKVLSPTAKTLHIKALVESVGLQKSVRESIRQFCNRLAIGQGLAVQDLYAAVAAYNGVQIAAPAANISVQTHEILDLQSLIVQVE